MELILSECISLQLVIECVYPSSHKFGTQENWDFRDFGKNGFSKKLGPSGFLKNGLLKKIGTYELGLYKIDF